jgi:AraC-like DNA-binding protein
MPFTFEQRASDSSLVHAIWSTQSERSGSFISAAAVHWELVLMRHQGRTTLTARGPETRATLAPIPADAEWLGITFKLGAFMPDLPPGSLLDGRNVNLAEAGDTSFWLAGSAWEFPTYDNADVLVRRLVRAGLLVSDPLVDAVMQDLPHGLSTRAVQYRFQRATGLTYKAVRQIQRASRAAALLGQGCPIPDAVYELGYFDQSHLTNSLRRYVGQTPARIAPAQAR